MSRSWSGVGPPFGYANSVLTSVCVSGDEIECSEIIDGDERWCSAPPPPAAPLRFPFERERESRESIEPDPPECDGWCRMTRLRRSDASDGREETWLRAVLVRGIGSGDAAAGSEGAVAEGPRECRGLKMDAKTDLRRAGSAAGGWSVDDR